MPYRRIFATPHVLSLTAASVMARLPVGMVGIGLVIFVHARSGSFGTAGAAAGAYTIGLALTAPLLGRLVDRRGPRPVLPPAALLSSAAIAGLVAFADADADTAPVGGLLGHLWPDVVEHDLLVNAYVVDSILIEVSFVVALSAFGAAHGSTALGGPFAASLAA